MVVQIVASELSLSWMIMHISLSALHNPCWISLIPDESCAYRLYNFFLLMSLPNNPAGSHLVQVRKNGQCALGVMTYWSKSFCLVRWIELLNGLVLEQYQFKATSTHEPFFLSPIKWDPAVFIGRLLRKICAYILYAQLLLGAQRYPTGIVECT